MAVNARAGDAPGTADRAVVAKCEATIPDVFEGDAVSLLQLVYRDPGMPWEVRIDCAKAACRFERPVLSAVATKDVTPASGTRQETDARIRQLLEKGLSHAAAITIDARATDGSVGGIDPA
jgi:hypothetical protein